MYLRPFLEEVAGLSVSQLSLVWLVMGATGLVGTAVIGRAIERNLAVTLTIAPLLMAAIALGLVAFGGVAGPTALLLGLWGLVGTALPIAWWTWLSRTLPDDAEAGGGLLFDAGGHRATFVASAALLCASAIVGVLDARRFPYVGPRERSSFQQ